MANEDMTQYLGVFLDEANEQLAILEQDLLELETGTTPELLQDIFRAAHTLKGSSRAMGFMSMGELTHAMEDIFDRLRNNALTVTKPIVDALFEALDLLKKQVEEVAARAEPETDSAELTARLRAMIEDDPCASGKTSSSRMGHQKSAASPFRHDELSLTALAAAMEAKQAGENIFVLTIRLADDCVMKSVRALMVMQSLQSIGSVLAATPGEEQIENEEFGLEFGITLATARSAEEVEQVTKATSEVADVRVESLEISPAESFSHTLAEPPTEKPVCQKTSAEAVDIPTKTSAVCGVSGDVQLDTDARIKSSKNTITSTPASVSQTVRVNVVRLDNLLNLVGELVIDQTRIAQVAGELDRKYGGEPLLDSLAEATAHFGRISSMLQAEIMKARMLPIDNLFNRFPRMMRDLGQKLGKEMEFIIEGRETELDRSVIEVIGDPLIHLLRNSVDHGLEMPEERVRAGKPRKGNVWLRARHEENFIVIEIEDDGRGIDPNKLRAKAVENGMMTPDVAARLTDKEALNLIFASGFSTAETVSEVSGRGVGMDIVKSNLTQFGALIEVESHVGQGTRFTIKLPLTLAIIRGLLVKVAMGVYVIPIASVVETLKVSEQDIHLINGREVILQRGKTLPLVRLQQLFQCTLQKSAAGGSEDKAVDWTHYIVVVRAGERRVGLIVDSLLGDQEIVIKSLGKFVGDMRGLSGATILGDGRIALIVDVNGLLSIAMEKRGAYAA